MRNLVVLSMVLSLAGVVSADVLWDQSDCVPSEVCPAIVDQEFPDNPTYSSYLMDDVSVDVEAPLHWNIQSMSVYFTNQWNTWPGNVTQARLNIFSKPEYPNCELPTEDPQNGSVVPVVTTVGGACGLEIKASDLNIDLYLGDYWVGLTPILPLDPYGQEFHCAAPPRLCQTVWRNPGNGFGFGTEWIHAYDVSPEWYDYDMCFKIEGTIIPEPGALSLLALGALALLRRR